MGPSLRKPSQVHHTQPACLLPDAPGPPSPFTLLEASELCPADSPTALAMTWHLSHPKLTSWQSEPQQPCSLDRPTLYQSPIRNLSFSFWVLLLPASSLPDLRGGPLLSWQMAASLLVPSTDRTPTAWRRVFGFHISIRLRMCPWVKKTSGKCRECCIWVVISPFISHSACPFCHWKANVTMGKPWPTAQAAGSQWGRTGILTGPPEWNIHWGQRWDFRRAPEVPDMQGQWGHGYQAILIPGFLIP